MTTSGGVSLDLSPAAAAAPRGRRILGHARTEAMLTLRNGEQLLLNLVIPLAALIGGLVAGARFGLDPRTWPASIMALAIWSASFTSLAIATAFERRYGVLERLAATPLSRSDLVAGKALATTSIAAGQLVVLAAVALVFGWRPTPTASGTVLALLGVALGAVTFAGFALALAGRLRAEVVLGLANLAYLAVAAGGGLVVPLAAHPAPLAQALSLLPFGALGELLRQWATGPVAPTAVIVLAVWAGVSLFLARKAFRWTS